MTPWVVLAGREARLGRRYRSVRMTSWVDEGPGRGDALHAAAVCVSLSDVRAEPYRGQQPTDKHRREGGGSGTDWTREGAMGGGEDAAAGEDHHHQLQQWQGRGKVGGGGRGRGTTTTTRKYVRRDCVSAR